MNTTDIRGLALTGATPSSAARLDRATELLAGFYADPLAEIDAAIEEAPGMVMGHCLRAALFLISSDRACEEELGRSVAAAEALAAQATDRERGHIAAARAWLAGDYARAGDLYGRVALENPHDLLALQIAHQCDFFTGRSGMLRDRVAQVLPRWDGDVPGFGYVLGMHAFGLEETNLYARAEEAGRRAVALNPRDPWAVHAVAHVMEMEGRTGDGIAWLNGTREHWAADNMFAFHNWWHLALHHLDREETGRVLALYDEAVRPQSNNAALEMIDASALLWRLRLRGIDAGDRWDRLADDWAPLADQGYYAFNDVHALMAFIGAGRAKEIRRVVAGLERAALGSGDNAMMSREVGLPLARALLDFEAGRWADAATALWSLRERAHRFGGSHAQRDLIQQTLLEAVLRQGDAPLARALAAERTEMKPSSVWNWRAAHRAATAAGDQAAARRAAANAVALLPAAAGVAA
ncbi:MAG TPA: tetratricopeptide repeat protein [Azospirillaceae bacterium]|nr:tetratricopeptide repeat protein [Azospirillaceae bacterium]